MYRECFEWNEFDRYIRFKQSDSDSHVRLKCFGSDNQTQTN